MKMNIIEVVESILGKECKVKLDLARKTFLVEREEYISKEEIDKICVECSAFGSLQSFKGNVVFFHCF